MGACVLGDSLGVAVTLPGEHPCSRSCTESVIIEVVSELNVDVSVCTLSQTVSLRMFRYLFPPQLFILKNFKLT